jgi:hypothetical protein
MALKCRPSREYAATAHEKGLPAYGEYGPRWYSAHSESTDSSAGVLLASPPAASADRVSDSMRRFSACCAGYAPSAADGHCRDRAASNASAPRPPAPTPAAQRDGAGDAGSSARGRRDDARRNIRAKQQLAWRGCTRRPTVKWVSRESPAYCNWGLAFVILMVRKMPAYPAARTRAVRARVWLFEVSKMIEDEQRTNKTRALLRDPAAQRHAVGRCICGRRPAPFARVYQAACATSGGWRRGRRRGLREAGLAGDDVADVAKRACAEFGWGAPSQASLCLVKSEGARPQPAEEAAELAPLDPSLSLAEAGVRTGSWLLARVPAAAPPPPPPAAAAVDAVALLRAYYPHALSPAEASALCSHASLAAERAALAAGVFHERSVAALFRKLRSVLSSETRARFLLRSGVVLGGPVGGAVGQVGTNISLALRGARVLCAKVGPRAAVWHEWEVSQAVHGGARPAPAVARALACEDVPTERGLAALLLPLYPLTVAAADAALPPGPSRARDDLALAVALSGLAAVAAFAAAGWAHGDIKPANMMLVGGAADDDDHGCNNCVLIDFGAARRHGEGFSEGSAFSLAARAAHQGARHDARLAARRRSLRAPRSCGGGGGAARAGLARRPAMP